jgi:hypothetical protein
LCFSCLAADQAISEFDAREAAQVAVFRERFRVIRRICYRCNRTENMLIAPEA